VSKGAAKVSVLCDDKGLGKLIRRADKAQRLKAVVVNLDRPVYEYAPALFVHVPKFLDLRPAPRSGNLIADMTAQLELDVKKQRAAVEGSYFEEPLPGQTADLRDAIRVGGVLGVTFFEVFAFDAAVRELRGETPLGEPYASLMYHRAYAHEMLEGLLPISTPGFTHRTQDPPDTAAQAASGAEKWMPSFLPDFADSIGARVEAHDPRWIGRCDEATRGVEAATAFLYSHIQTTGPCRAGGPVPVRIVPLLVNPVGDWLACAALIGKGAVLVLPECRDEGAKAALVVKLATELWGPVQAWLEGSTQRAVELPMASTTGEAPKADRETHDGAPAGDGDTREIPEASKLTMAPCYCLAGESYEWACKEWPKYVEKGSDALYDRVKEHWPGYHDAGKDLPDKATWKRYVREYVRLTKGRKNTPRHGRRGRSTVNQNEL